MTRKAPMHAGLSAIAGLILLTATFAHAKAAGQDPKEPIRIGFSAVMSGPVALIGQESKEGAELRVQEINQAGGVLGRPLKLYFADHACDPAQGVPAASSLISNDNVSALIGTGCSSVTLATMPVIKRSKVVQLEYLATNPKITSQAGVGGNPWEFRLNIDDAIMVQALSDYIADQVKSVVIVAQNDDYGRSAAAAFADYLKPKGVQVLDTEFAANGTVDYRPTITHFKSLHPQGMVVILDAPNAAPLALQCQELGFKPRIFGRGTVVTPAFQSLVKNSQIWNGAVEINRWASNPKSEKFQQAYTKAYGRPPELNAAMAYYAVDVLAAAIQQAGSDDRTAICDALAKLDLKIPGLGEVKFDQHDQAHPDMFLVQWHDGKITLLTRRPTE